MNRKLSLLYLFVGLLSLQACDSAQTASVQAPPPMPVKLLSVSPKTVEDSSTFVGVLKSRQSVSVQPQVPGQVQAIYVKNGDQVAVGAKLIELDRSKQQASVNSFAAAIESNQEEERNAEAMLQSLEATRKSRLANLRYAQQQHQRYSSLRKQGAVAQESVDQWENQMRAGQGDLQSVEAQITAQNALVAKSHKLVKQSKASMKEQQEQLRYFTLTAPFSGVIGDIPVRVGEYVTQTTQLTTIDQSKPLELYLNIPTQQAPNLHLNMPLELLNGDGETLGKGTIFFISPQVNNDNQSVLVKSRIDNNQEKFRSGQYVTAKVIWATQPRLLVPTNSVSRLSGQDFVFVAERGADGKLIAKQKPIKVGDIIGDNYKVLSGLKTGENVITSGVQNLTDGAPVSPKS